MRAREKILNVSAAFFLFSGAAVYIVFWMQNTSHQPQGVVVTIFRGTSFNGAAENLRAAGVIRSVWTFKLAGRILGYTKSIRTGKYLFVKGQSNLSLLKDIGEGKSRMVIPVTIPEGWRLEQIARRYHRDLGIDAALFLSLCRDTAFIRQHHLNAASLEGYLLPDTYSFYWQNDEEDIITRMLDGFQKFYSDSLLARQHQLNVSQQDVLTLASIIEAESGVMEERPVISGVYWNRLRKKMRLDADPTVQYALGMEQKLTHQDLLISSPYNTYMHQGLPPGPINNPGRLAILAALYPSNHGYLYFVATGIGGHHFARSYSEHEKNINSYRRVKRAQRYGQKK
jgi:UPF0755 protein